MSKDGNIFNTTNVNSENGTAIFLIKFVLAQNHQAAQKGAGELVPETRDLLHYYLRTICEEDYVDADILNKD